MVSLTFMVSPYRYALWRLPSGFLYLELDCSKLQTVTFFAGRSVRPVHRPRHIIWFLNQISVYLYLIDSTFHNITRQYTSWYFI